MKQENPYYKDQQSDDDLEDHAMRNAQRKQMSSGRMNKKPQYLRDYDQNLEDDQNENDDEDFEDDSEEEDEEESD